MLQKKFTKNGLTALALVSAIAFAPASNAAITSYSSNFEAPGTDATSGTALSDDGWIVYANVFNSGGTYLYGYGTNPAPNDPSAPSFSLVGSGEGGPSQGVQQLVALSDYNNADHGVGNLIEANVFQETSIDGTTDAGLWTFTFDAKQGDIAGATTALAFIKTLNPAAGWATTNFLTIDTTSLGDPWSTYSIDLLVDSSLAGQVFQMGFSSTASNYEASGVIYDNVCLNQSGICDVGGVPEVPVPAAVWLFGSGLLGLVGVARRRKASIITD